MDGHIAWVVIWCKLWWSYEYRVGTARFSAARSFRGRAVRRGWTGGRRCGDDGDGGGAVLCGGE